MPEVSVLDSWDTKLRLVVTSLASVPSLATAALTLVIELLIVDSMLDAVVAVLKLAPDVTVRFAPPSASDWAARVILAVPLGPDRA